MGIISQLIIYIDQMNAAKCRYWKKRAFIPTPLDGWTRKALDGTHLYMYIYVCGFIKVKSFGDLSKLEGFVPKKQQFNSGM